MNDDQFLMMCRKAGITLMGDQWALTQIDSIRALVDLSVAEEREACAKLCEAIDKEYEGEDVLATWCAEAIRARDEK